MTKEAQIYWNTLNHQVSSPIPILLIDDNSIDNVVNQRILEYYGAFSVSAYNSAHSALEHLSETKIKYHYIFIDLIMPIIDGFKFIDHFNQKLFNKQHGHLVILSVSINPLDRIKANNLNIKFIEKPLTLEKLLLIQ